MVKSAASLSFRTILKNCFLAIALFLTGCMNAHDLMEEGLAEYKAILIYPIASNTTWVNQTQPNEDRSVRLGKDFVVMSRTPGEYRLDRSLTRRQGLSLSARQEVTSSFGDILVTRTPSEEKVAVEEVVKPEKWGWKDGKYQVVQREVRETRYETRSLPVYYEISFSALNLDSGGPLRMTLETGDIVLSPGVAMNVSVVQDACREEDQPTIGFFEALAESGPFFLFTWGSPDPTLPSTSICPIEAVELVFTPVDLDSFRAQADPEDFPLGVLERMIVREPEKSSFFENDHEFTEDSDGTRRYRFHGVLNPAG